MADKADNLLVALDIGSSKIVCAVAEPIDPQHFKLIGMEEVVSAGMREGNAVDMDLLVEVIRAVVTETEKKSGVRIQKVTTGISGISVVSENTDYMRLIPHNEIEQRDVDGLIADAQKVPLASSTMKYISTLPQEFAVDGIWGIKSPVGLAGSRLDGRLHVVTAKTSSCMSIAKALARSGLELVNNRLLFNPLASAEAILTPEERRLGVLMIDIGSSLADVSLYSGDSIRYSKAFRFGGDTITNDISIQTKLSTIDAEQFKVNVGMVDFRQGIDPEQLQSLPEYSGLRNSPRVFSNRALAAIMEASLEAKFDQIYREIKNRNLTTHLSNGVVISGGSSVIPGLDRLIRRVFGQHLPEDNMIVRIGYPIVSYPDMKYYAPQSISMSDHPNQLAYCSKPAYSTVMGYLNDLNRRHWKQSVTSKRKGILGFSVDYIKELFLRTF